MKEERKSINKPFELNFTNIRMESIHTFSDLLQRTTGRVVTLADIRGLWEFPHLEADCGDSVIIIDKAGHEFLFLYKNFI